MAEEISNGDNMAVAADAGVQEEAAFSSSETEQTQQPPTQPTFKVPAPPLPSQLYKRSNPMLSPPASIPPGGYHCGICRQNFFSFPQLVRHKQFHDEERPYPCGICGKRFLSRSHHNEHQRVHTGERPFPCDQCERSFSTHHNLKRHMAIHSKEEVYRCKTCGVLFCQRHANPLEESYNVDVPEPLPDLEHDSESDPEPIPPQNTQPDPPPVAIAVPVAPPKPELKKYTSFKYKLQEQLQQELQQRLVHKLKDPGHSSTSVPFSLPIIDMSKKKKKKKKEKKKKSKEEGKMRKSLSIPVSSSSVAQKELWPVRSRPNKHRIAYDIEVVL